VKTEIYHVRKRLAPRGGSQFYRDRSERQTETMCGAPVTAYDGTWNCKARTWYSESTVHGTTMHEPCAACVQTQAKVS